jgi:hypothetical protein
MKQRGIKSLFVILFSLVFLFALVSAGTLKVTQEHPFLIDGEWIPASDLQVGDLMQTIDGKQVRITKITDVEVSEEEEAFPVYNLETGIYHNFVVCGDDVCDENSVGVVVKNSNLPSNGLLSKSRFMEEASKVNTPVGGKTIQLEGHQGLKQPVVFMDPSDVTRPVGLSPGMANERTVSYARLYGTAKRIAIRDGFISPNYDGPLIIIPHATPPSSVNEITYALSGRLRHEFQHFPLHRTDQVADITSLFTRVRISFQPNQIPVPLPPGASLLGPGNSFLISTFGDTLPVNYIWGSANTGNWRSMGNLAYFAHGLPDGRLGFVRASGTVIKTGLAGYWLYRTGQESPLAAFRDARDLAISIFPPEEDP